MDTGPLSQGELLQARYRIERLLGQGGMSRVYLATDERLGLQVAIKENLQAGEQARVQFELEARILARLTHPNLPRVSDHFVAPDAGRQYLVMDYIDGEDLEHMVARTGPLPETKALAWIRQVLDAVEYLHAQDPPVVHRDVKPSNIKITPAGRAVLVDFGIAKLYQAGRSTGTGARAVTPGYAPPEQYGMRTTPRSDIYSLGATLYTMLTGRVPPEAPLRQSGDAAMRPPGQGQGVSAATGRAIDVAMSLETSKRWGTVADLRGALAAGGSARQGAPVRQSERGPTNSNSALLPLVGVVAVAGVVFLVAAALGNRPLPTAPPATVATATSAATVTSTPTPTGTTATAMPTISGTTTPAFSTLITNLRASVNGRTVTFQWDYASPLPVDHAFVVAFGLKGDATVPLKSVVDHHFVLNITGSNGEFEWFVIVVDGKGQQVGGRSIVSTFTMGTPPTPTLSRTATVTPSRTPTLGDWGPPPTPTPPWERATAVPTTAQTIPPTTVPTQVPLTPPPTVAPTLVPTVSPPTPTPRLKPLPTPLRQLACLNPCLDC